MKIQCSQDTIDSNLYESKKISMNIELRNQKELIEKKRMIM